MRSIIKYICMFGFLTSCIRDGTILDTTDLTTDFENIWWEPEGSSWLNMLDKRVCLEFITYLIVEEPADGTVLEFTEGGDTNYIFSDFQRFDGGYHLLGHDTDILVFQDDDGFYIEVMYLGLSDEVDIIPCSLGA